MFFAQSEPVPPPEVFEVFDQPAGPIPAPPRRRQDAPRNVHVYGRRAALCFEADTTRQGVHTVAVDAAQAAGERRYDWGGKIRLQLTEAELPQMACVLFGWLPRFEATAHGPAHDKGLTLEHQGVRIFARVFARDAGVRAVPIEAPDIYRIGSLVLRQLRKNSPWLTGTDILNLLRATVGRQAPVAGPAQAPQGHGGP